MVRNYFIAVLVGTVQFQFAQATSNGTNTTVSKNAQLIVWRVS